jgi:hypothetical protein
MAIMKKSFYVWSAILLAGISLLVYGAFFGPDDLPKITPTPIPTPTQSVTESPIPTASPTVASTPEGFIGPTGLKAPASCSIGGEINYLEKRTYASSPDAKISWKNVDSSGRLIKWQSEPADNLSIGPNIYANLRVPDGEYGITVGLPENPLAKEYTLRASVTYGQLIKGNVEVKEVACSGKTKVKLNF